MVARLKAKLVVYCQVTKLGIRSAQPLFSGSVTNTAYADSRAAFSLC